MKYARRAYAEQAVEAIFEQLREHWSTLAILATGTGKTWIYLKVAARFLQEHPEERVVVVAHREELISQPRERWRAEYGEVPQVEMASLKVGEDYLYEPSFSNSGLILASVQTLNSGKRCRACTANCKDCGGAGKCAVQCESCPGSSCERCDGNGTIQTKSRCSTCAGDGWVSIKADCASCFEHFTRRMQRLTNVGLLIIDEAHHAPADSYARLVRYFKNQKPGLKVLGLTATSDRMDRNSLGQVFETVAFEYNLPIPIDDGWLTPIRQELVVVEGLNLANVRTTAGDLNAGDLEQEMIAEKVLHGTTTPLVEIACHLLPGTVDKLISENRLNELPALVTRYEPTLVHAVDVAHAERMTEILNRYLPGTAACVVGTTPRDLRRETLECFARGQFWFLLSCGVFLEGTDLPNVSVVGVARPTKSRALYCQMVGRGLRPLAGCVDGLEHGAERCAAIANSAKPSCLIVDFTGNSGKHKLISSVDILADGLSPKLIEVIKRKLTKVGSAQDVLEAIRKAQEEAERKQKKAARRDAQKRAEREQELKAKAARRREGIVAGAQYSTEVIDPFNTYDLAPSREPEMHRGKKPTEKMLNFLRSHKVPCNPDMSFWEALLLIKEVRRRREQRLCTYKQAAWLKAHGYPADLSFDAASRIIDGWAKNGWKPPVHDLLAELRRLGHYIARNENGSPVIRKLHNGAKDIPETLLLRIKDRREEILQAV
jgi:superfamily II DNA or RNA helicase